MLVGDFLYSRAFQLLTQRSNVPIMKVLANTTNAIAEGEVMQLVNRHNSEVSENNYMEVINYKRQNYLNPPPEIGAMLGSSHPSHHQALVGLRKKFGFSIPNY